MSLQSWKDEFYFDEHFSGMNNRERILNCLRKWIGALPSNTKRHNLIYNEANHILRESPMTFYDAIARRWEPNSGVMSFNVDNCALCVKYYDRSNNEFCGCVGCPLFTARDNRPCFYSEEPSEIPYNNVENMVSWLMFLI